MPDALCETLRAHYRPLEPIPSEEEPRLASLAGVRAVLFDLYGTLFISASGEVGTAAAPSGEALAAALDAIGVAADGPVDEGVDLLFDTIRSRHAELREQGIEYPEIDICAMWQMVLAELARRGRIAEADWDPVALRQLAVEYEVRANPCWPMPHLKKCLVGLREGGLALGVISNSQFYTPLLFDALLGKPVAEWGFDPDLLYYSYQHGQAKPGTALYKLAVGALRDRGIEPNEVIYVGNDMLNDIRPAALVGFRTALFAGDARSLRYRDDDPRVTDISPNLVITDLTQLQECIIV